MHYYINFYFKKISYDDDFYSGEFSCPRSKYFRESRILLNRCLRKERNGVHEQTRNRHSYTDRDVALKDVKL